MNKTAIVYIIKHLPTGDGYVGCTTVKSMRWARHRWLLRKGNHHSHRLQALWDADGENSFAFETLETVPASTAELRVARELHWIAARGTLNTHVTGPDGFTLRPDDIDERKRQALALIASDPIYAGVLTEAGKKIAALAKSPEARAAMSRHSKRRWQDPEERKRLRAGLERRWADPAEHERASEKMRASDDNLEVRKKRAASLAATWADPERNAKLRKSRAGQWSPEARERHAAKMRAAWVKRRNPA